MWTARKRMRRLLPLLPPAFWLIEPGVHGGEVLPLRRGALFCDQRLLFDALGAVLSNPRAVHSQQRNCVLNVFLQDW